MTTPRGGVLTLANPDDLVTAARLAGWLHRPEFADVQISITGLPSTDSAKAARTIRSLFNDCACALSTLKRLRAAALVASDVGEREG